MSRERLISIMFLKRRLFVGSINNPARKRFSLAIARIVENSIACVEIQCMRTVQALGRRQ